MANIKSAIKRVRLAAERTARNRSIKSSVRGAVRKLETALTADPAAVGDSFRNASRALDRAVSKGVIHRNAAARKKSRLAKKVNAKASQ